MEDNIEQMPFYDSLNLQVTEKSFYNTLTGNIPLFPNQHPVVLSPQAETTPTTSNNNNHNFLDENSRELIDCPIFFFYFGFSV